MSAATGHLSDHEVAWLESMPRWSDVSGTDLALRFERVVNERDSLRAENEALWSVIEHVELGYCSYYESGDLASLLNAESRLRGRLAARSRTVFPEEAS